jgi:hypothetical protein
MSTIAPPAPTYSPLAHHLGTVRTGARRTRPIVGMVVHTTGSGPAEWAKTHPGVTALSDAIDFYLNRGRWAGKGDGFPHYVIGYDGTIHLICPETHIAWHAGWKKGRARWDGWSAPPWWAGVWNARGASTPADLIPPGAGSPNDAHIGVELLGSESGREFTPAQYDALARLVADVFRRNGLTLSQPPNRQLLGHEDVEPILRANRGGGWDPGAHRTVPTFSWNLLWSRIQGVGGTPSAPAIPAPATGGSSIFTAPWRMFQSIAGVAEAAAAFARGERDPNRLTDFIFFARHPERGGRRITSNETGLAQEWRWIRDNIVAAVLRAAPAVAAPPLPAGAPSAAVFQRGVPDRTRYAALVPILERYRGDIPLVFLVGWVAVESDAVISEVTKKYNERGFFQLMPSESADARPPIDHNRLSLDPEYSVKAGLFKVRYYMALADQRYPWIPKGSDLYWRIVKLQHAMGSAGTLKLLTSMRNRNVGVTWDTIKRYGPPSFVANVDKLFRFGPEKLRLIGR